MSQLNKWRLQEKDKRNKNKETTKMQANIIHKKGTESHWVGRNILRNEKM